jgi:hesA/moeB/thiF family protein
MYSRDEIFARERLVAGDAMMDALAHTRVIVFGVGGVGSWCCEALCRSGVGHLTLVDSDLVAVSNINRQLMATTSTVGTPKVEALARRLLDINPGVDIVVRQEAYTAETADSFDLGSYDYVIDAIDSLENKALLILRATAADTVFFSSMGAARKLDPTKIGVAEFFKVEGCPLARALRTRFRRRATFPARKFKCVYSPETIPNRLETERPAEASADDSWTASKAAVNGTFAHTTAVFGMTLAGLVVEDLYKKNL